MLAISDYWRLPWQIDTSERIKRKRWLFHRERVAHLDEAVEKLLSGPEPTRTEAHSF
jgi:hypothetical protein